MKDSSPNKALAILVNVVAPYRVPIYVAFAKVFDVTLYVGGAESNRLSWEGLKRELPEHGVSVKPSWGFTLKRKNRFDFRFLHITPGYIVDLIRDRPDAVISNEMGFRSMIALTYGLLFVKPVWIWWGGTLHTERSVSFLKRVLRFGFARCVRHWISYGQTSSEYLSNIGVSRERILQIQNCVDDDLYRRAVEPALAIVPRPVLLFVGQLIGRKGIELLLESAARLQREGHQFSLLIVGGGPQKEFLQHSAWRLGLQHVLFDGEEQPEEMPAIYRSADSLVFPTLEDVWGLVVSEALWSGIPVLCSIYAGCAAEIVPTENRFDPLDSASFDHALRRAVLQQLKPADVSALLTCTEVADRITTDIARVLDYEGVTRS